MITSTCPCNRVEREAETRAIRIWFRTLRVTLDDINDACYSSAPSKDEGTNNHSSDFIVDNMNPMIDKLEDLIARKPVHPDTKTMKLFQKLKLDNFVARRLNDEKCLIELLLKEQSKSCLETLCYSSSG